MIADFPIDRCAAGLELQAVPDLEQNAVSIFAPLMVPKSKLLDVFRSQEFSPFFVHDALPGISVMKTVQFNGQLRNRAVKIENENSNWVLSAEFESGKSSSSQNVPQFLFLICLVATKPSRIGAGIHGSSLGDCGE